MIVVVVLDRTIRPQFEKLEQAEAMKTHARVGDSLDAMSERLEISVQDLAVSDDAYGFLAGKEPDRFIASHLAPEFKTVSDLGVNALMFVKADGELAWGRAFDLSTQEPMPALVSDIGEFLRANPGIAATETDTRRGFIRTSSGLLFIAVSPISKADKSATLGKIVAARVFDIEAVKKLTNVDFTVDVLSDDKAAGMSTDVTTETLGDRIEILSLLSDIVGRPLAALKVTSMRDGTTSGQNAIRSALGLLLAGALAIMAALWVFLDRILVRRLRRLAADAAPAWGSRRPEAMPRSEGSDELEDLAQSFNAMNNQIAHLRDALADKTYFSGLSEWASGTMHNVINELSPIGAMTWQLRQLYEGAWLKNIQIAVSEHASGATDPERRQKLNAYLIGSASRFAEAAKLTVQCADQIDGANTSVLDMVAEFHRYAKRETQTEAIDLLPLIEGVAASTIDLRARSVDVVLPAHSEIVVANSIILRQIFANVFINAVESIEQNGGKGRIEVSFRDADVRSDLIRIAISDNGRGISRDKLRSIFRRGACSKSAGSVGQGLHWCANAVYVIGGSICAESAGPGTGATIVVEIPRTKSSLKEAA